MRVLVTGGAGFIGSNFVRHLLEETDDDVVTLDALTYAGSLGNLDGCLDHARHEFVEGDIRDRNLVAELTEDVDAIVNFAAQSHVDRSIDDASAFVSTNVGGTGTLLSVARERGIDRFVQLSTDEVYGEIETGTFEEDSPIEPRNPYAATKAGADHLARSYHVTHDLPVLLVRPSNTFGPRQHAEKLIPKLIERTSKGESLPLYGDGRHVRTWTYVRDTCRAIDAVLRHGDPGEAYNVASGEERENLAVAKAVLDAFDADENRIEFVEDRPGHDRRYALAAEKIRDLGWTPEWSFEEGLAATIEHYSDALASSSSRTSPQPGE